MVERSINKVITTLTNPTLFPECISDRPPSHGKDKNSEGSKKPVLTLKGHQDKDYSYQYIG
jgi:hypothetical protein